MTNWPSGIFMLAGHLDSAALAKAIASLRSVIPAINIGACPGATLETAILPPPTSITLRRPDDWHVHLRDGAMLQACAVHTALQFARAVIMPNLVPPVTRIAEAAAYRDRIRRAVPAELNFEPLMT